MQLRELYSLYPPGLPWAIATNGTTGRFDRRTLCNVGLAWEGLASQGSRTMISPLAAQSCIIRARRHNLDEVRYWSMVEKQSAE
jgi:hypothetical protein